MTDKATPLEELHAAVQTFSNSLADTDRDVGMVTAAVVVWEETSSDTDGDVRYSTLYASTGDGGGRPSVALGLALNLLTTLKRDVIGFE